MQPRLTRDLVNRLPERVDKRGPIRVSDPPPEYFYDTAADILSNTQNPDELWVFAIGSLIWNPRCDVVERKSALVRGWRRSFCIGPDRRFRGNPDAPGLMLSLDRGGQCWGVAMRMNQDNLLENLVGLLQKEPPCPPEWVMTETNNGHIPAIAFTVSPDWELYHPEPPIEELADILATSVGHVGSMPDYLLNTINELENAGVHDQHLWQLQEMVADRLERLAEPG